MKLQYKLVSEIREISILVKSKWFFFSLKHKFETRLFKDKVFIK